MTEKINKIAQMISLINQLLHELYLSLEIIITSNNQAQKVDDLISVLGKMYSAINFYYQSNK